MSAAYSVAVAGAGMLGRKLRKIMALQHTDILFHRLCLRLKNLNALLIQFREGAASDARDNNCVNMLAVQRLHWIALTVLVVLVTVLDCRNAVICGINNNEGRSRTEMSVHLTIHSFNLCNRETHFHLISPFLLFLF